MIGFVLLTTAAAGWLCLAAGATAGEAAPPVVVSVSTPVAPDETVLLVGDGLTAGCTVAVGRLADGPAGTPAAPPAALPAGATACAVLQPSGQSLKFIVPGSLTPGVFACQVANPAGQSRLLRLNVPEVWWVQGDNGTAASPGGWIRVQGKCLAQAGAKSGVFLDGPRQLGLPAEGDGYSLRAALPADLPPGEYRLHVHNGRGGNAAWSDSAALQVRVAPKWPDLTVDVRALGAAGDGLQDDTAAIQGGLARLRENGGGVLYFPRGRYLVTDTLHIPEQTVLRGEGRELCLVLWPDREEPLADTLVGRRSFAIEDLTFGLGNHGNFLRMDVGKPDAGDVRLQRLRVLANRYRGHMYQKPEEMTARFARFGVHGGKLLVLGGTHVEVLDCDFLASGCCLYLTRAKGALIRGNRFRMGRFGWYWLSGSHGVIFEDNELLGADLSTWGGGINNLDGSACSQNVYFARNRLAYYYGGDHEALTSDGSGAAYFGRATAVTETRLTLSADPAWGKRDWRGCGVFVLGGRGLGQYRALVRHAGREIEVDRPWDIPPDAQSWLSITNLQRRLLITGNEFEEVGVAIQFYGTSVDCICDGNRVRRGLGFIGRGMNYHGNQPSWYVQWLRNEITEGNSYGNAYFSNAASAIEVAASAPSPEFGGPLTLGAVVRGNRLANNAFISIGAGNPPSLIGRCPWLWDVIVEGNAVERNGVGVVVADEVRGVWLRNNRFKEVTEPVVEVEVLRRQRLAARQALAGAPEPIGYWAFDELRGGRVPDVSGHQLDATPVGRFVIEPAGVKGAAARFDGSTHLTVGSAVVPVQDVLHQEQFTLAVWVKPEAVAGRQPLIGKRYGETIVPFILSLFDGTVVFEAANVNHQYEYNFSSPRVMEAGVWQHLAVVVESGRSVALYRNGARIAGKAVGGRLCESDDPLVFGRDPWPGPGTDRKGPVFYQGLMDEAKFWARALTPAEVMAEHRAGGANGER